MLQHFVTQNKDRRIFRKNIGRALLNAAKDPYLSEWERDRTSRAARSRFGTEPDLAKRQAIEASVSKRLQETFTFVVFRVDDEGERLDLESKLISTLSLCGECKPSRTWLGSSSPKEKISTSGLWLGNELEKEPLSGPDLVRLATLLT